MKHFKPEPLYAYKRAQAMQEHGGITYKVAQGLIRYTNGFVRYDVVKSGLERPEALRMTRQLNGVYNVG